MDTHLRRPPSPEGGAPAPPSGGVHRPSTSTYNSGRRHLSPPRPHVVTAEQNFIFFLKSPDRTDDISLVTAPTVAKNLFFSAVTSPFTAHCLLPPLPPFHPQPCTVRLCRGAPPLQPRRQLILTPTLASAPPLPSPPPPKPPRRPCRDERARSICAVCPAWSLRRRSWRRRR
jgi:hypothetical protein